MRVCSVIDDNDARYANEYSTVWVLASMMSNRIERGAVVAVHLKGTFNVSRAAAPHFKQQGSGAFVHMTATSGLMKKPVPDKIAPFVVALCSEAAAHVTGQIFGVRNNEIYLFSQPRPFRTAHSSDGWTAESIIERVLPMFANDFYPLHRSGDIFTWDPV